MMTPKILFLTTEDPASIKAEWPYYQNWMLPKIIRSRGAIVDLSCWRYPGLDVDTVASYDLVTFLWCNDYHRFPIDFPNFVRDVLVQAQKFNSNIHIFNDPSVILWNTDKHYLTELADAGFRVPKMKFVHLAQHSQLSLIELIYSNSGSRSVVLKPTISGSAKMTHLIRNPRALTAEDLAFLDLMATKGTSGDLIVQEYEEDIKHGEYSFIFVNSVHTHTILKIPRHGEFRCQGEFGGAVEEIRMEDVPKDAIETAYRLWQHLEKKFRKPRMESPSAISKGIVYARIDGIMRGGEFVLMEVEAIEPHLWLEAKAGPIALDELYKIFLPGQS